MNDCPICKSKRCVDDVGYCSVCGKSTRTKGNMMTRRGFFGLCASGTVATVIPPDPGAAWPSDPRAPAMPVVIHINDVFDPASAKTLADAVGASLMRDLRRGKIF